MESDQIEINRIIREVGSGIIFEEQGDTLKRIIANTDSIDGVVLACTELPLVYQAFPLSNDLPIIDTIEILARRLIELAR